MNTFLIWSFLTFGVYSIGTVRHRVSGLGPSSQVEALNLYFDRIGPTHGSKSRVREQSCRRTRFGHMIQHCLKT